MQLFREKLEEFARKHNTEIQSDPIFRHQFQSMCAQIGVDPLASSKGFWAELLGVGNFYYELAIQIITICITSREKYGNGGLLDIETLQKRLKKLRKTDIDEEDIVRAVKNIQVLGNGYKMVQIGQKRFIQSVPMELSTDHISIMSLARQFDGKVSINDIMKQFHWTEEHSQHVLVSVVHTRIFINSIEPSPWRRNIMDRQTKSSTSHVLDHVIIINITYL